MDSSSITRSPQHRDRAFPVPRCSRSAAGCSGAPSWPRGTFVPGWAEKEINPAAPAAAARCLLLGLFTECDLAERTGTGLGTRLGRRGEDTQSSRAWLRPGSLQLMVQVEAGKANSELAETSKCGESAGSRRSAPGGPAHGGVRDGEAAAQPRCHPQAPWGHPAPCPCLAPCSPSVATEGSSLPWLPAHPGTFAPCSFFFLWAAEGKGQR